MVFHVAADYRLWTRQPEEMYRANVEGTRGLLRAAQAAGVSFDLRCRSVCRRCPAGIGPAPQRSHGSALRRLDRDVELAAAGEDPTFWRTPYGFFAPSGVMHSMKNVGPGRLIVLAVLAPPPGK